MNDLTPHGRELPLSKELLSSRRDYARKAVAESTSTQYRSALKHFGEWCIARGRTALPANWETVSAYIANLADEEYAWSTIRQRLSAISQAHEALEVDRKEKLPKHPEIENPCEHHKVRQVAKGIRRKIKVAVRKKKALSREDLQRVVDSIQGGDLVALRDRALLLLGFAGGFRRAELAALRVEDLEWREEGLLVQIRSSKANQEGRPEFKAVLKSSTRTLDALREWVKEAEITSGPIFRSAWVDGTLKDRAMSGRDVGRVVVRCLVRAGMLKPLHELKKAREKNPFGAHSLRSGFITEAHGKGASISDIMKQTGQRNVNTVAGYIQKADLFKNNASDGVAL